MNDGLLGSKQIISHGPSLTPNHPQDTLFPPSSNRLIDSNTTLTSSTYSIPEDEDDYINSDEDGVGYSYQRQKGGPSFFQPPPLPFRVGAAGGSSGGKGYGTLSRYVFWNFGRLEWGF